MKAENSAKIQFDSLSANEAFARGAAAAFLARYDPTVPQLADIKTAVSEAVTMHRPCLPGCHRSRDPEHRRLPGAAGEDNGDG